MKKVVKLTESDLMRIVKRVINEGVGLNTKTYSSSDGDKIFVSCNEPLVGTLNPNEQYQNKPYLRRGQEAPVPLTGEFLKFFCNKM